MEVYENIMRIRKAKGVTKTFIAKQLGVSLQCYRYLENGDVRLDVNRMQKIGKILGVQSAVFLDDGLTDSVVRERGKEVTIKEG